MTSGLGYDSKSTVRDDSYKKRLKDKNAKGATNKSQIAGPISHHSPTPAAGNDNRSEL